jgi:polyphosphate kinase
MEEFYKVRIAKMKRDNEYEETRAEKIEGRRMSWDSKVDDEENEEETYPRE